MTNRLFVVLLIAFVIYVTLKGHLAGYLHVLGLNK